MPEHVIELKDGEPVNVESRRGTRVATFTLQAVSPANTVAPFVRIGKPNGGTYLNAPLVEDPVRAAVQVERARCKALAEQHLPSAFGSKAALLAAIDAPGEKPSEHQRGERAMQRRMISEVRHWWPLAACSISRATFEDMLASLEKMFVCTEPTQ